MSSRLDKAIKDFIQIIREAGNKGTSPLDAQAEVLRIDEDGTAWVHLPGGVDETPVKLTINAKVGDKVYVRLSGGRAWITGNQTAPPTDDKTAIAAKSLANLAGNQAKAAQKDIGDLDLVIANWCYENDRTVIDGGKIYVSKAFADSIFAQTINATGKITGAELDAAKRIGIGNFEFTSLDNGAMVLRYKQ